MRRDKSDLEIVPCVCVYVPPANLVGAPLAAFLGVCLLVGLANGIFVCVCVGVIIKPHCAILEVPTHTV